jgi:hypothetical protein
MVVRGGSSSDSRLPSTNALTCHSKSFPIRRAYPKTCPLFQICQRPTFLKPSVRRVRRRCSTEPGEIDSKTITSEGNVAYTLLPRRPPGRRVPSCGMGVTSSILPILKPARASIRIAACAPGPGVLALCPPGALTLMWSEVIPRSFATRAAAAAACIAA